MTDFSNRVLTILYIIFINTGPSSSVNPLSLWMKANGWSVTMIVSTPPSPFPLPPPPFSAFTDTRKTSAMEILTAWLQNIIPTAQYAVQFICTVSFSVLSDYFRSRPAIMSVSTFFGFLTALCLAIWTIPVGLKWFAFFMQRAAVPYGPLSMSWANEICGADAEERAVVLGIMNASGYAFNAWLPLLTYPTLDSPRFRKGFVFTTAAYAAQAVITWVVWYLARRDRQRKHKTEEEGDQQQHMQPEVTTP